jgi:hypothetical protein
MAMTPRERAPLVTDAIPPVLRRRGVTTRQMLATCLAGALVLAIFASRDTPGWAERLGDSALDHELRSVVGAWDGAMDAMGFTRLHEFLRGAMHRALDWQWSADNQ